ncbi:MAG: PIN domain-containing protein [Euryarchaeota archaeon]|nr:PIN domain-containing protein [Euryarchaeota archaeon]
MTEYFLDSYALIALATGSEGYTRYSEEAWVTGPMNLAEAYYILLERGRGDLAEEFWEEFSKVAVEIPGPVVKEAMRFRLQAPRTRGRRLSYVDAIGYTFAREAGLRFLTGDDDFRGMENVEFVK